MTDAEKIAKKLNDHHMKTCAGFYGGWGGRFFQARAVGETLEVSPDFGEHWVVAKCMEFHDHNGRPIQLGVERVAHGPDTHPDEWEGENYVGHDGFTMHLDAGGAFEPYFAKQAGVTSPPQITGNHSGKILRMVGPYAVQKIGRDTDAVVTHELARLSATVVVGDVVDINYDHGRGVVVQKDKGVQR